MPYQEFITWLAYFKVKGEEERAARLGSVKDQAMARQKQKPIRKR